MFSSQFAASVTKPPTISHCGNNNNVGGGRSLRRHTSTPRKGQNCEDFHNSTRHEPPFRRHFDEVLNYDEVSSSSGGEKRNSKSEKRLKDDVEKEKTEGALLYAPLPSLSHSLEHQNGRKKKKRRGRASEQQILYCRGMGIPPPLPRI